MQERTSPLDDIEVIRYYLGKCHATDKEFFHEQAREANQSSCMVCGLVFEEVGQQC